MLVELGRRYRLRHPVRYILYPSPDPFHQRETIGSPRSIYTNSLPLKIYFVSFSVGSRCHVSGGRSSCSVAVLSAKRYHPRSRPFRREHSLNFPLASVAFTSHRFRRSRFDASSSPRDVTYRSAPPRPSPRPPRRLRDRAFKMPPFRRTSPFPRENLKNGSAYRDTFQPPLERVLVQGLLSS